MKYKLHRFNQASSYIGTRGTTAPNGFLALNCFVVYFLMHFLPRDASAERGYEIACRLSVCPSVCLSVTIRYSDDI